MSQTESKIKMDSPSPTTNNWKGTNNSSSYENGVKPDAAGDQATTSSSSADSHTGPMSSFNGNGPDPAKLKSILDRTGYTHQVTAGQRKYGGPPPDWPREQASPQAGCEVFVGKIPREVFEDELIPLFEKIGKIWDLRLMVDPTTSQSRGYGFITYCNKADAQKAVAEMDGHKIRKATLKVNISVPNVRLFVGNIPKIMSKDQIFTEFEKVTEGLVEVITYSSPDDRKKNRGFCFLEFDSHKNASSAKRKLSQSGMKMFKCDILVDWADPQEEPDEETMSKVKVLYVRNLTQEVNESQLKQLFEDYGSIERVKKIKDYAFVHFDERDHALEAMEKMNGKDFCGSAIEISLAKPPSDRKKKEEVLRNRERRMLNILQQKQFGTMFSSYPQSGVSTPATAAVAAAAAARNFRPPLAMVPPIPTPAMIMSAAAAGAAGVPRGKHRFNTPVNPLMSMGMNRQGQAMWPHMMYYDSPEVWYSAAAAAAAASGARPQFGNFPHNMSPGWPYFANGQVPPHLMSFGSGGPGGDANASAGNSSNAGGSNNNSGGNNRNSSSNNSGGNNQNRNRNNNVNGQSNNNNNNPNRKFRKSNNTNSNNTQGSNNANSSSSPSNNNTSNAQSSSASTATTTTSSSSQAQPSGATTPPATNGQASSSSGPSTPKK